MWVGLVQSVEDLHRTKKLTYPLRRILPTWWPLNWAIGIFLPLHLNWNVFFPLHLKPDGLCNLVVSLGGKDKRFGEWSPTSTYMCGRHGCCALSRQPQLGQELLKIKVIVLLLHWASLLAVVVETPSAGLILTQWLPTRSGSWWPVLGRM